MPRPPKSALPLFGPLPPNLARWAESLGEALGRGVAKGINAGLAQLSLPGLGAPPRRGRPPNSVTEPVPPERRCSVQGCARPSRSKGLCSAHYQAERRRQKSKAAT